MSASRRALLTGAIGLGLSACCRSKSDDGTAPTAGELPPLTLRDDSADLLLTYLDERGDHHTATRVGDVPACCRTPVRVVVTSRDDGASTPLLYVADLSTKKPDGSYAVTSMPRARWESLAADRRRPTASASATAPATTRPGGRPPVIIYGAAWCGPCHQAQDFLKARGVPVVYHDIEAEPEAQREMSTKLSRAGRRGGTIPVIDVAGRILIGFDPGSMTAALKAAYGDSAEL